MNIRVNLPDGSVVNFPQGTPQDEMQAEIEKFLASRQSPQRQPQAMAQTRPPMSASDALPAQREVGQQPPVESLIREANPVRRRPAMSIEEAQRVTERQEAENLRTSEEAARDPATMTDAELRAAEIAARNPIGNAGRAIADTFRGATRATASATQNALGSAAAALGMPGVGGRLMQGADDIDASLESRRALEAEERAAADSEAQRLADERARRQGQAAAPSASATQDQQQSVPERVSGQLPSIQNPNAGQRTDVAMPRALSIQGAREQGRGENAMTFSMGDGQTVQVRAAPPAALKNGVKSGMDFLMERADQITLKMLQAGDISGATAFRDFVQGEQAQKGMTYMNRAVIAANYGDSDAFTSSLDRMVKAFDGDGDWQIDTKGTRLIQTDNGQAVGAMLSMRNKTTGEVFEQEYMGMQNVIAALSDFGSPTAAYERQQERVAAAVAQKIANAKDYQSAFDDAFKEMFDKDSFVDLNGNAISQEEMDRRVRMVNERIRAVRPDLVPQSAPRPGAASGVGAVTGGSNGQPVPTWGN